MDHTKIERTARVAHEANRAWCLANGDDSQPSWDDAPFWQKKSVYNGVLFYFNNPDADEIAGHYNWMVDKASDGWVYGDVKDPEAKTHPCMVPFQKLPREQQVKDRLFCAIVRATYWGG